MCCLWSNGLANGEMNHECKLFECPVYLVIGYYLKNHVYLLDGNVNEMWYLC